MGSAAQLAKRALVKLLLSLAAILEIHLVINRDSPEADIRGAYAEVYKRAARVRARKEDAVQMAYTARVRGVIRSAAAQEVAKRIGKGYMKTCKEVMAKKGAASSGEATNVISARALCPVFLMFHACKITRSADHAGA